MREFYLDSKNGIIGGVCAGLSKYLGISIFLVRLITFFLIWDYDMIFWAYILTWLLAPDEK